MKVELSLYATDLKNVAGAFRGTSDPFAVVTQVATAPGQKPVVLGKTETIENTLSPSWASVFTFDYDMGTPMRVVVSVFDEEKGGDHKSMGSTVFDIEEVLGARGQCKGKQLKHGGTVFVMARKSVGSGLLRVQLSGVSLKNTEGFLRKSDPFYELSRQVNSAGALTWDNVFRSEVVKDNLNPSWKVNTISIPVLCGGDLDLPLKLSVYDFESSGKHVLIGQTDTSVNKIVSAAGGKEKLALKGHKNESTGSIQVVKAEVAGLETNTKGLSDQMAASSISSSPATAPTSAARSSAGDGSIENVDFLDYVAGGLELNVVVAIDFTGSNGNPRKAGTLHYLDGGKNDYEKAIEAIVTVLAKYDHDKKFPVFGFGAKLGGSDVQHAFPCGSQPEAVGVKGVLEAYRDVFKTHGLVLSTPTDITQVVELAAKRASDTLQSGRQAYTILLIVTDGAVTDVKATADVISRVSDTPLSIVIVGVGNDDFTDMQFLDDVTKTNQRDIAQFVEFNKYCDNPTALTSATLQEIPSQVVSFFQSRKIQPRVAITSSEGDIVVETEEEEIDLSLDIGEHDVAVTGGGVQHMSW